MTEEERNVVDCYRLVCERPEIWAYITKMAARDHAAGVRLSSKLYVEMARRHFMLTASKFRELTGSESDYGIKNAYSPIFARMLIRQHPEYAGCMKLAKSAYDGIFADEGKVRELVKEATR